jgi:hypothetical protein
MNKTIFYFKWSLLFIIVSAVSCKNEDDKKATETTKTAVDSITDNAAKSDSASMKKTNVANVPEPVANKESKSSAASTTAKTKKTEKKIAERNPVRRDTTSVKSTPAPVSKNEKAVADVPVSNQSAAKSLGTDAANKPFVSKYGIIPRDANENSLTVFYNTFPDKHTLIKVNFDGAPDAEMNNVKTQIIKVLKKSGYVNVSDHSETIQPKQMPKDIHYELQHDGSVVFWVPVANQE